jgi:hypothetical protein
MPIVNKGALHKASRDFLTDLNIPVETKKVLDNYIESYEDEIFEVAEGLFNHLGIKGGLQGLIDPGNKTVVGQHHQVLITILIGVVGALIGGVVSKVAEPVMNSIGQGVQASNATKIPDPDMLIRYFRIFPAQRPVILDKMAKLGYSQEHFELMTNASASYMSPDLMIRAWHRGIVAEKQVDDYMRIFGFNGFDTDNLKKLSQVIPPVQDLISMAVREAFTESAVARFKLDANFPDAILPYTSAQGLSKDWVTRYWRAHWQLPGINQAMEMFQRLRPGTTQNTFTSADLDEFMVTADIPEFFRVRLKEIAYQPVTRIDIRRLYKMGIYKEADVLKAYQDAGYSPDNAQALTRFTVLDAIDSEGTITKQEILSAYQDGFMTEAQASKALLDAGNSTQVVLFEISVIKHRINVAQLKQNIALYTDQYVNGLIDDGALIVRLNGLALDAQHIQVIIAQAQHDRAKRLILPTKTDVQDWYKQRIISDLDFTNYMIRMGYALADIQKYLRAINNQMAVDAQKAYQAAVDAQDKLKAQQIADNYRHAIAAVDVQIAQYQLAIANLKKSIQGETDADLIEKYNEQIKDYEVKIKQATVTKAQIKTQ